MLFISGNAISGDGSSSSCPGALVLFFFEPLFTNSLTLSASNFARLLICLSPSMARALVS
ncbi:hypothetical protein QEJ31_12970 [Pigmentibacter sp. JX0631]|uniref:hypothetical protein n=1 Tax=Pigmentibacter sp. JX0631 TaxID=2976982 RepID=UPI002469757E|nr:hypothetical protein [Pigmentibacter sp. JX0631]WGL59436.1 hypothetical protein QEJ31_12970 [Pigmentibacter sp. JX0631]